MRLRAACLLVVAALSLACQSPRKVPALDEELVHRSSTGLATQIAKLRRQNGMRSMWAGQSDRRAGVKAYVAGPSSLLGDVSVHGAEVIRFEVSSLKERVGSVDEGVVVTAILAGGPWPESLELRYRAQGRVYAVPLQKKPVIDDWSPLYVGKSGAIRLGPRRAITSPLALSKGPEPPAKGAIAAVERSKGQTIWFYRTE